MTTTAVEVPGGAVHVLATVHGLATEAARVEDAFRRVAPRVVALALGVEGVAGLRHHLARKAEPVAPKAPAPDGDDPYEYDAEDLLADSEIAYGLALQKFGKVLLPPPDLLAAVRLADESKLPIYGVDFSEEQYGEAFAKHVTAWALFRYSRRSRRIEKRPPKAATAREFALAWDAHLTRVKGYATLEREREARIAAGAKALAREHGAVLLVVDPPREAGVLARLREP